MRQILTLLFAVCALTLTSCKKENNESLVSTTWETVIYPGTGDQLSVFMVFEFAQNTVQGYTRSGDEKGPVQKGTYTYKAPNVTIIIEGSNPATGVVDGDKLEMKTDGGTQIFTRK